MLGRREILKLYAGALAAPMLIGPGSAFAQGQPLLRFGVVADPQYAPVAPRGTRYYAHSLWKLGEAIKVFNEAKPAFVVTLGDIIDRHWESYAHILPVYDRLAVPHHFVLGNHDFEVAADFHGSVYRVTGLTRAYYAFKAPGWRFLVIDGNDVSIFGNAKDSPKQKQAFAKLEALKAKSAANAQIWNGGMSDTQMEWFTGELNAAAASGERVVVFGHYPVFPDNEHNMWDYERFLEVATASKSFAAFMNGHNHAGNFGTSNGKHFVNFKGMVETPDKTAYALVDVYADRLEIKGFGLEESRTLAI